MIVAPIPVGLLVSGIEPVKIIVFPVPFLEPHPIGPILMVIPCMLIMMLGVLVTTIVVSFFPLLVSTVLSQGRCRQECRWSQQGGAQQSDSVNA